MRSKISAERKARLKELAKRMEEDLKNRTADEIQKEKEFSDMWSIVDGDGLEHKCPE